MMNDDELQRKIDALPPPIVDHLYSEHIGDLNDAIVTRNGLNREQTSSLFRLLRETYVRETPFGGLADEVKKRFGFDDARAKKLALDIAGYRLLPLDKWLGDVSGYLRRLGGKPEDYPDERVQFVQRTREEAAAEVVSTDASAAGAAERIKSRIREIVTSFLAGVRTEPQTIEVLTRSDKVGGAGLDMEAAERIVREAKEEANAVVIRGKAVGMPDTPEPTPASSPTATAFPPAPVQRADDFQTVKPEDEKEIARVKDDDLPAKGVAEADETSRNIDASIMDLYLASGLKTSDEAMEKRVKTVIGNRLRDVRDEMETLETLVQPKELGGLGLSQDKARTLLALIRSKLSEVHAEHAENIGVEKKRWVETERRTEAETPVMEAAADRASLDKLYQSIVATSEKAKRNAPVVPAAAGEGVAAQPAPAKAPVVVPPNLPVNVTNPVPPSMRPASTVPLPPQASPARPPMTTPAQAGAHAPTPIRPIPNLASVAQAVTRPKMEDVRAAPRLTGPVEELRAITIVDFRRLSRDPREACLKIKDKIDLLAEQSYGRRTEGIAAWTASEVVRTYLELMREGLNGVPLKTASETRQAAKKPYLTPEEFAAVSDLMRQLRY